MSSPNSFSLLNRFATSTNLSRLSDSVEATPSNGDRIVVRVTCFAQPLSVGSTQVGRNDRPFKDNEIPTSIPPSSTGFGVSNDEWWRSPPQHRGRGIDLAELKASGLYHGRDDAFLLGGESVSDWVLNSKELREHTFHHTPTSTGTSGGVPVYVMLPLDSVTINNTLNRRRALNASLATLKSCGVDGIMMDVWWGIVEKDVPMEYSWSAYRELIETAKKYDLKVQAVMSFHQCGGNVGDSCNVPLPRWVVDEVDRNSDLVYTDKAGTRNYEYLSLGCDTLPVLRGRSPIQVYGDFMRSFRDEFREYMGETIVEIQVGMGPAGELRFPSYPESNGRWTFPGIGEFQCYDKYMLANLKESAEAVGHPEWGLGGPANAGHYSQWPDETAFFRSDGDWNATYGQFFLKWYSDMLIGHGERILSAAAGIFRGSGAHLSGKVAGIHWHYGTRSHAPELTAGYYNTRYRDGYVDIARAFARHGVTLNFTCIEMKDSEQPGYAQCSPEGLLKQVATAARKAGIRLAGENALPRFDKAAHDQVVYKSRLHFGGSGEGGANEDEPMCSFTYLRMCETLFQAENWRVFVPFVRHMSEGRTFQPWEEEHREAQSHVHATSAMTKEAEHLMFH